MVFDGRRVANRVLDARYFRVDEREHVGDVDCRHLLINGLVLLLGLLVVDKGFQIRLLLLGKQR